MKPVGARDIIVLLGGPGAGKGTQSEAITRWLGIPRISTGELLRSDVARERSLELLIWCRKNNQLMNSD